MVFQKNMRKKITYVFIVSTLLNSVLPQIPSVKKDTDYWLFRFYEPTTLLGDPVNKYSIVHFVEYGILSLFKKVQMIHALIISFIWEATELFLPYSWARESWGNKIFDIAFNCLGFSLFRKIYYIRNE